MATGGGGRRPTLPTSSSLDQQQSQPQQNQQAPANLASANRRSSASNFDQSTGYLASQYNQQQIDNQKQQQQIQMQRKNSAILAEQQRHAGYYFQHSFGPDHKESAAEQSMQRLANEIGQTQIGKQQPRNAATNISSSNNNNTNNNLQQQQQQRQAAGQDRRRSSAAKPLPAYVKDDVDIVFNRLMALEAFRKLHPTVIRNLCSYAFIERIDRGVIVFRQGDDAINWYALLEGSVDVRVSQSGSQKAMFKRGNLSQLMAQRSGSYELGSANWSSLPDVTITTCSRAKEKDHQHKSDINNNINSAGNLIQCLGKPSKGRARSPFGSLSFSRLLHHHRSSSSYQLNEPAQMTATNNQSPTHSDPQSIQDGVTLCTLGVGTTFGASVMPGKSHSVSVVTSDDCTLLRVRRADFQEIFNEQSHLINNVESSPFCSFTSLNRLSAGSTNSVSKRRANSALNGRFQRGKCPSAAPAAPPPANQSRPSEETEEEEEQQRVEREELVEVNLEGIEPNELSSHLMRAGWVLRTLMLDQCPQMIQNRRIHPQQLHRHRAQPPAASPQQQPQQPQQSQPARKQLVSVGSSSQLLFNQLSAAKSSAAGAAGRKVANYVAGTFMRSNSKVNTASNRVSSTPSNQAAGSSANQAPLYSSNSFDANCSPSSAPLEAGSGARPASSRPPTATVHSHNQSRMVGGESSLLFNRCMIGRQMVDWLLELGQANTNAARFVSSRLQAISMWQVLLEQGIVFAFNESLSSAQAEPAAAQSSSTCPGRSAHASSSGLNSGPSSGASANERPDSDRCQFQFCDDPQAYYKFWFDREGTMKQVDEQAQVEPLQEQQQPLAAHQRPSEADLALANESLWWSLKVLSMLAPDACFRLILSRQPFERSLEEVDIVFEELQQLKALSHLTNSVKKELAACVTSEHSAKQNTVIFNQGDPGHSWYIILRGSVNVVIVGKGVVCTLHEGDDFGKLALVNDAARAATIVTNEPNCYFLRVDKQNFNTILRDVEANTVRLKEHGKEVLILQRVPAKEQPNSGGQAPASGSVAATIIAATATATTSAAAAAAASTATPMSPPTMSTAANELADGDQLAGGQQPGGPAQSQLNQQQNLASDSFPAAGQTTLASSANVVSSALKYMVMAGTAEKMLEHLLETRIDGQTQIGPLLTGRNGLLHHDQVSAFIQSHHGDNFLEDFILTHKIFMPTENLCNELLKQYQCQTKSQLSGSQANSSGLLLDSNIGGFQPDSEHANLDDEFLVAKKRRVVKFIRCWMLITREHFFHHHQIQNFLTTIHQKVKQDACRFISLQSELKAVGRILELHLEEELEGRHKGVQHWIDDIYGNILPIRRHSGAWELNQTASPNSYLASLHQRRFELRLSAQSSASIQAEDEIVFRVYCADHTFATLKTRIDEKAAEVKQVAARKLNLADSNELVLVHVKSNGERIIFNDLEFNLSSSLSVNGRIFVCPLDHIDAISPLPEQDPFQEVYQSLVAAKSAAGQDHQTGPAAAAANGADEQQQVDGRSQVSQLTGQLQSANNISSPADLAPLQTSPVSAHLLTCTPTSYADIKTQMSLSVGKFEEFSSRDVAYCLTQFAWSLLRNMHEFELIYTVFGRHNFKQITANLNVFLRHFNELQYWVVTQICLSSSLSKRVQILRKFIKIAAHCKELQNLNAFFAIIMGLSNMAVARLTQTWEKLPSKLKRTFSQFESLIDPSRNHRRYRIFISKMDPPIIPFMPLFLKDMTFAHEGNKTYLENGLINFEKMQMVAQTLRTIRYCKSRPMKLDSSACKFKGSIRSIELFFRDLKIIDNQRTLTQMSHQLEHRKT